MARAIYQWPSDNVAGNAAITGSADDAAYPASYIADGRFLRPAKLTTTSGNYVFAFAGAQRLDLLALGPHTLDPGLAVQIQGNASNAWGGPTLSAAITIPALEPDGRQILPWLDLTGVAGYSTSGFQFWRLNISGVNSRAIAIGEIWLGALKRSFSRNYKWNFKTVDMPRFIEHETEYGGITTYDLQVRQRRLIGEVDASSTGLTDLQAWYRSMRGRVYPGLFLPDPAVNDAWWVRQTPTLETTSEFFEIHRVPLDLEELSQGVPL